MPLVSRLNAVRSAEIGKAFVEHYYRAFDASIEQRSTLQTMYQDASMLTGPQWLKHRRFRVPTRTTTTRTTRTMTTTNFEALLMTE